MIPPSSSCPGVTQGTGSITQIQKMDGSCLHGDVEISDNIQEIDDYVLASMMGCILETSLSDH